MQPGEPPFFDGIFFDKLVFLLDFADTFLSNLNWKTVKLLKTLAQLLRLVSWHHKRVAQRREIVY